MKRITRITRIEEFLYVIQLVCVEEILVDLLYFIRVCNLCADIVGVHQASQLDTIDQDDCVMCIMRLFDRSRIEI